MRVGQQGRRGSFPPPKSSPWCASPSPEPLLCALQGAQLMAQPDELIDFHHLKARRGMSQLEIEDEVATDLQRATGTADAASTDSNRLNRVLQLTGALKVPLSEFTAVRDWLIMIMPMRPGTSVVCVRACARVCVRACVSGELSSSLLLSRGSGRADLVSQPPACVLRALSPAPACPSRPGGSSVRGGVRDGAPVRHRAGRDGHQPHSGHHAESVPGAGHHGRPQAGGAAAELHTGPWGAAGHQVRHEHRRGGGGGACGSGHAQDSG